MVIPPKCFRRLVWRILFDAKLFGIPIKHKPLTRDERDFQRASPTFETLVRDAVNKRMAFKQRFPHGGEILSMPHQLRACLRKISRSFLVHCAASLGSSKVEP